MKKLILPPFLPLLALLLFLLVSALMTGAQPPVNEEDQPLRWVMFVPAMVIVLYPVLLLTNIFDSCIQRGRPQERWIAVLFAGAALSAFLCIFALRLNGFGQYAVAILCAYGSAGFMNWWRNRIERRGPVRRGS